MPPVMFSFKNHFDTEIEIGDYVLPIKVKRLPQGEEEAFEAEFSRLLFARGDRAMTREEAAETGAYCERIIRDMLTIEPGLIEDDGRPVVDGEGFIRVFHARKDVLSSIVYAIFAAQRLTNVIRKNSKSPRGSEPGSATSIPASDGGAPDSTVGDAAQRASVEPVAATEPSDPDGSGASAATTAAR